jgi:hypothetical protein
MKKTPMDLVKDAKEKGLFLDVVEVETVEDAESQLIDLKTRVNTDESALEGIAPLLKVEIPADGKPATYPVAVQRLAIFYMETFTKHRDDLKIHPNYGLVSQMFGGVEVKTLRNWWNKRDTIRTLAEGVDKGMADSITYQLQIQSLKMALALESVDYDKLLTDNPKAFVELNKLVFMQLRLLKGESTANKETIVTHRGAVQMVAPDTAK